MRRDPLVDEMMLDDPAEKRAFLERSRIQTIRKRELARARRQFSAVLRESTFSGFLRVSKKNFSGRRKGYKRPQAVRDKISRAKKGRPGHKQTQAARNKISSSLKGFKHTEATRKRMSAAQKISCKGRTISEETKKNSVRQ